jgi:hypothetical protein
MTLKRSLRNYLGSEELAELALNAIKPYWLQRIGELNTRYKMLTDYEIQLMVDQNPDQTLQEFAKTLQNKIFRAH